MKTTRLTNSSENFQKALQYWGRSVMSLVDPYMIHIPNKWYQFYVMCLTKLDLRNILEKHDQLFFQDNRFVIGKIEKTSDDFLEDYYLVRTKLLTNNPNAHAEVSPNLPLKIFKIL
jgi:hypothetical protein